MLTRTYLPARGPVTRETGLVLDKKTAVRLVGAIVAVASPIKIVLFGSHACGRPGSGSDVDIAVILDRVESRARESARISRALRPLHIAKDILLASRDELEYHRKEPGSVFRTIDEKGIVLYAR